MAAKHQTPTRAATSDASPGIEELIADLGSRNGFERLNARRTLIALGQPAVQPLIEALSSDEEVVRWEAAKAFTRLHAPEAAPALVNSLEDRDGDVRWLSAESLVALGPDSLPPVLEALVKQPDSIYLREGAYHVLRELNHGDLAPITQPVLNALQHYEPELVVPLSAEQALAKLHAQFR